MFRPFNNSHLQFVHETLENSYTRNLIWAVYSVVWGGLGGYEISYVSRRQGVRT